LAGIGDLLDAADGWVSVDLPAGAGVRQAVLAVTRKAIAAIAATAVTLRSLGTARLGMTFLSVGRAWTPR